MWLVMVHMLLTEDQQQQLLDLARASIVHGLEHGRPLQPLLSDYPAEFSEQCATFVTLELNQRLRGCIGMLQATRPLVIDIAENAYAAAFNDPRFPAVTEREVKQLVLSISILSPAKSMSFSSEEDLLNQLEPDIDGLILKDGSRQGTFLPSVWGAIPQPEQFLQHLKQKAGLPTDYWSDTIQIQRYTTRMIK